MWLTARGMSAEEVGILLALPMWVRIVATPAAGAVVDRLGRRRRALIALSVATLGVFSSFALMEGFWPLALTMLLLGAASGPLQPIGDSLVQIAARRIGVEFSRIRVWGSISFIAGAWGSGLWFAGRDPSVIHATLIAALALIVVSCVALPDPDGRAGPVAGASGAAGAAKAGGVWRAGALWRDRGYLLLLLGAALIQTSHAVYYGFGTLAWQRAGLSDGMIGWLWAEGVIAEVALFTLGAAWCRRLGPTRLLVIAGAAGALRWAVLATTAEPAALMAVQGIHALTFGATYLAVIEHIGSRIAPERASSAHAMHAVLAHALPFALLMPAVGELYAAAGRGAYWAAAALAALGAAVALALAARRSYPRAV